MNYFIFLSKKFKLVLIAWFCFLWIQAFSQIIPVGVTYTSDNKLYPFDSYHTIYGLTISGKTTLSTDTSLVRVILSDDMGNEWLVYEAYTSILPRKNCVLINVADETKFLEVNSPRQLTIQIIQAEFLLDTIFLAIDYQDNLVSQQQSYKEVLESRKADSMNYYIARNGMLWYSGNNEVSNLSYVEKKRLFGDKYNLCGLDFYKGGLFDPAPGVTSEIDTSSFIKSWDWRERHGANDPLKSGYYYDGDEMGTGWLTSVKNQIQFGCNGLCYIYGPLGAIESVANLYLNDSFDYNLSEQHILDCDANHIGECDSGLFSMTNAFVRDTGVVNEEYYPRNSNHGTCYIDDPPGNGPLLYKIYIKGSSQISLPTNDAIKDSIINCGPLIATLEGFSDSINHNMVLIGYKVIQPNDSLLIKIGENDFDTIYVGQNSTYIGKLAWLYKNSWGEDWGFNGFACIPNEDFHPSYVSYYKTPISDTLSTTDIIHPRDADRDGYWNWGISKTYPLNNPCSWLRDSDDSENRLGPFDSNYYSIPVMPQMVVTHGLVFNADTIHYQEYYSISVDTTRDTTIKFYISNPGSAQLNLVEYNWTNHGIVTIEYQEPSSYFDTVFLPKKSVCMDGDTTSFKVKVLAGVPPGSLAHLHIPLWESDLYPDSTFEFTLVLNGCETLSGYDSVKTVVTWADSCRSQIRDLYIKSGGELTITGTVLFSPEADLIVEKEGKLIIDGGKLSKSCGVELWNGIQVWGDTSLSQCPDTNQGFVEILNHGCIEYAHTGIFTGKIVQDDTLYPFSGGIVYAEDGVFLNNEVDVAFLPFINDHPYSGEEMDNLSSFRNCTFKTFDQELVLPKPIAHVVLDGVKGVDFYSCTFKNQDVPGHPFGDRDKGTGILVFDSHVAVRGQCTNAIIPCNTYDSTYFENLRYGIRAFNTGGNKYFHVTESVFDNNIAGIYLSGFHEPSILSSRFYSSLDNKQIPGLGNAFFGGLYLDGSTGYHIENNRFTGPYDEVPDSGYIAKIGIYVKDSGEEDNEIYNNFFIGIDAGIIAEGVNKGELTGLCLKCNDFRICLNDMLVVEDSNYRRGRYVGIKENQGANDTLSSSLAGNTFTAEVQNIKAKDYGGNHKYYWSYFNDADHINYYHHADDATYTTYPSDSNVTKGSITLHNKQTRFEKARSCPSNLNHNEYKNYEDPWLEKSVADNQLIILKSQYDSLLDGGNTQNLDFEIINSTPDQALELRQDLLSNSPYLSDTVMKQAIYQEDVLQNVMIRDILSANPQAAKSDEILSAVENREDPMPDYLMADILLGLDQIGALEGLESVIGYWSNYRTQAVNQIIRGYLADSSIEGRNDSLINLFQNETSLNSKYRLAFSYWESNQPYLASSTLSEIQSDFTLTPIEQEIHQEYLDYFGILQTMRDSSLYAFQLDSISIQELIDIMNSGLPLISSYARGMLMKGRQLDYTETVFFPAELKWYPEFHHQEFNKNNFLGNNYFHIFPNPCGDFVIAYFNTIMLDQKGIIILYDIFGTELKNFSLKSFQNQVVLDLSDYPIGTYLIQLYVNDERTSSKLLIKGRK